MNVLAADELFAVELLGQSSQRGIKHTTTKAKHQMEGRFLLDVVVGESTAIFQLLASEDQSLLIRGNSFLVLDLLLHIVDGIRRLHIECDSLSRQSFDKDLHDLCSERRSAVTKQTNAERPVAPRILSSRDYAPTLE